MIGLGFNAYIHDTAAALLIDGCTAAFAEEERFNRDKHTTAFPHQSIQFCMDQAGVSVKDLDYVAFYWDPFEGFFRRIAQTVFNLPFSLKPLFSHQLDNFKSMRTVESYFRQKYGYSGEFYFVNHYLAHATQAAYRSGFEEASVLIVDGNGEIATTWLGHLKRDGRIVKIKEVLYPHSIGLVWCTVTEYLGYRQNSDEGKVMGLAAFGDGCLVDSFNEVFDYRGRGEYELDLSFFDFHKDRSRWFSKKFADVFGPPRLAGERLTVRHQSVAQALQSNTEVLLKRLVSDLIQITGSRNLCYSGGVALNCAANGYLVESGLIDDLFIPPAAYDAGAAEGSALYVYQKLYGKKNRCPIESVYLGPGYGANRIETALQESGLSYRRSDNIARDTADILAEGKIVGWFQGRQEMGPRALGNRSILADPRPDRMKDHLNQRVKHREWYRPFGPSVLAERADEIFRTDGRESPYMLLTFRVRKDWRKKIPAVVHADNTARIQTIRRTDNASYYDLIKSFETKTGVPVILNTSFNVMGEPIVTTPKHAVECFKSTGIDVLCIGDFICEKEE